MQCPRCLSENKDDSRFCSRCGTPLEAEETLPDSLMKTLAVPLPTISNGTIIADKFRIVEELGRGGMGIVYKAEDIRLKRTVALKFLPPHLADFADLKERFLVEAQAAAALSHPNICVIHEIGEAEGRPFIAMEYVKGETLRDRIRKQALTTEEALAVALQIAAGLGEAHAKGIVHRDVKSANIMVTPKGRAKVMDFGLAKLRSGLSLTRSRTTLGTIAYMSPEQARGGEVDGRSDIWSLGVVLYEILTGELPFRGDHDQAVIHAVLHREPASLKKAKPDAPSGLEEVIFQALAKKPSARYPSMEELAEDLEALAEGLAPPKARPARAVKLAVLPFANLSGDPDQEYLSDGLTQEMITQMGMLHPESLSVIARASVMRYKKGDTPVDRIGADLGVNYVLEGSTLREANLVRINAVLIQVSDQTQLWADSYQREFSGILALQNEVAESVAKALSLKLLPSEKDQLAKARPVNPEAYDAYLKGMFHWYRLNPQDLETALHYFESALDKDPDYALAYAGIALVWIGRNQGGFVAPSVAVPKIREAASKALELDDTLAEVHYVMAILRTWHDGEWNWEEAEGSFKRALEINPNYPDARVYYSNLLCFMGRPEEALAQGEKALELDPYNALFRGIYGLSLLMAGRRDDALLQARHALKISPNDAPANSICWEVMSTKGSHDEALAAARTFFSVIGLAHIAELMRKTYEKAGYSAAMSLGGNTLAELSREADIPPCFISYPYAYAGDKEHALAWLEKGLEIGDPNMPYIIEPAFADLLYEEPRYRELLRKMNLEAALKGREEGAS